MSHGASPNNQNKSQQVHHTSPLRIAVVYGKFKLMSLLLKYGANVNELFLQSDSYPLSETDYKLYMTFLKYIDKADDFNYIVELNKYIENVNIYRLSFLAFFKFNQHIEDESELRQVFDMFMKTNYSSNDLPKSDELEQSSKFKLLQKIFQSGFHNPKSLKELSRLKIHNRLIKLDKRPKELESLDLPVFLRSYLTFVD